MNELIKFLKSFGLKEKDIQKIVERTNYDPQGLYGTNIYSGMFGKPTAEQMKEIPFLRARVVNPLRGEKATEGFVERLAYGRNVIDLYDDEIAKIGELILNKQLVLTPEQKKVMLMNVNTRNQIANDIKLMEEQAARSKVLSMEGEVVSGEELKSLQKTSGKKDKATLKNLNKSLSEELKDIEKRIKETVEKTGEKKPQSIIQGAIDDFLKTEKILDDFDRTGYVRATVRQIMREDIQSGKLKLPKEIENEIMQGLGEPIDTWRKVYGEGALEQIDSIADDLSKLRTEEQAAQMARSKFTFEPDVNRPPGSYTPKEMQQMSKNKSRQLTKDEIADYEEAIGRDSEQWMSEGTIEEAEEALKRSKAEEAYYYKQYKAGKLDPESGEIINNLFDIYKNKSPRELMFDANSILKGKLHPELSTEQRKELVEKLEDIIFEREPPETFAKGGVANLFIQRDM